MACSVSEVSQYDFGVNEFNYIPYNKLFKPIKDFINREFEGINDDNKRRGRPAYPKTALLAIVICSYCDNCFTAAEMARRCERILDYKYVADGIEPCERTLQYFIEQNGDLIYKIFLRTIEFAHDQGFTNFNLLAVDGTIIKARNSIYYVLKMEDIDLLLEILKEGLTKEEYTQKGYELSKRAYKFFNNKRSYDNKIKLLLKLKSILEESEQTSIGLTDMEARWMLNKKGKKELSYNLQIVADYESKMIISIDITDNPTDHHQLPQQIENAKQNIGEGKLKTVCADNGYHTEESFNVLKEEDIELLIPTRKQNREDTNRLSSNPYSKDYFVFDFEKQAYICPQKKILPFKKKYIKTDEKGKVIEVRKVYYTNECKNCPVKEKCTKSNVRVITDYGSDLSKLVEIKMETPEAKKEYAKRSHTVEPIFGILKYWKDLNTLYVMGKEAVKTRVMLKAIAYNIIRLDNLVEEYYL